MKEPFYSSFILNFELQFLQNTILSLIITEMLPHSIQIRTALFIAFNSIFDREDINLKPSKKLKRLE